MRAAILLSIAAALTGCAVVPPSAWNFDPTRPTAKAPLPAPEFAALSQRVAQLQIARNDIRVRIAGETDAWQRQRDYDQLHRVGLELSPLERRLAAVAPAP